MEATACKNAGTQPEELKSLPLDTLSACDCDRCHPVAAAKELDELRIYRQEIEAKEAAAQEGKRIADEVIGAATEVDAQLKELASDVVTKELEARGFNHMSAPVRQIVERKMQFGAPSLNTRYGRQQLSPEMKSFVHWAQTGVSTKTLVSNVGASGGFLVPDEFRAQILRRLIPGVAMRRAGATVINTTSDALNIPVLGARGAGAWTAEAAAYTESDPALDQISLTPYKYARIVYASEELLADSVVNIPDLLAGVFADDFSTAEDAAFIAGNGTAKPTGITANASIPVVPAGTGDIATRLAALVYALPEQYVPGASFLMSRAALGRLANLRSGGTSGTFVWGDAAGVNGAPATFMGFPIYTTENIPVVGAAAPFTQAIFFGNMAYYYIADRQDMRLQRSEDYRFNMGLVSFRAQLRVDGKVADAGAFRRLNEPLP